MTLFRVTPYTEIYTRFEASSYLRLTDFVFHSTLGWTCTKKKKKVNAVPDSVLNSAASQWSLLSYRGTLLTRERLP